MDNRMCPITLPNNQDGMAPGRFRHFLAAAPPGAVYIYHIGFLLQDRYAGFFSDENGDVPIPHKMGDIAWLSAMAGEIVLLQKRRKEGQFIYLAIKRGLP